jgi:hypothetical protein
MKDLHFNFRAVKKLGMGNFASVKKKKKFYFLYIKN